MNWIERNIGSIAPVLIVFAFLAPFLITDNRSISESFNDTGPIGDTIGGLTSPFLNLLSVLLLYFTLNSQNLSIKENRQNTQLQREVDLINSMNNNLRENFKLLRIQAKNKDYFNGLEAIVVTRDYIIFNNQGDGFYSTIFGAFLISCLYLEQRTDIILRQNFNSKLQFNDKQLIFEENLFRIEFLISLREAMRNLSVNYTWPQDYEIAQPQIKRYLSSNFLPDVERFRPRK